MSKVARTVALRVVALSALLSSAAWAQVGHDPAHSPYRPLLLRTGIIALGTLTGGSAGKLGVGPNDGPGFGVRFETKLTGPTDAFVTVTWNRLERMVADPAAVAEPRITGPVKQPVLQTDVGLAILLSGDKTWHGFVPYLGGFLGVGWGSGVPQDSSGYNFNRKFVSGPLLGFRLYFGERISLRSEGRLQFWRVSYPSSFFLPPPTASNVEPFLNSATTSTSEWTAHPTLLVGLGYSFRF